MYIYIYCIILYHICEVFPKKWGTAQKQPSRISLGDGLEYALALRSAAVYVLGICSVPLVFPCRSAPEVPVAQKKRGGDVGFNGLVENDDEFWRYII